MAEIKNLFVKSKMNKDLDARLLTNGEYRDAQNISVSKSEGADVGAVENILGNIELIDFETIVTTAVTNKYADYSSIQLNAIDFKNLEVIGQAPNLQTNSVVVFLTDWTDTSNTKINDFPNGALTATGRTGTLYYAGAGCFICYYNFQTGVSAVLAAGSFLNFSKTHPMLGMDYLEDFLYFTDNRNQPRKININTALSRPYTNSDPYYRTEDNLSVCKYSPYEPIGFVDIANNSTLINATDQYLPSNITTSLALARAKNGSYFELKAPTGSGGFSIGDQVGDGTSPLGEISIPSHGLKYPITVISDPVGDFTGINIIPNKVPEDIPVDTVVTLSRNNPQYDSAFSGDPDLIKEEFPRYSYRYRYDDGEYSLMAPFSQIAFIPEQFGYFSYGDEQDAAESGIVKFVENRVDKIFMQIPMPAAAPYLLKNSFKISELQILVKNAGDSTVKVIDDLSIDDISFTNSLYSYQYDSTQPFKTLPEKVITRVSDKAPIRAASQAIIGNRVVYGNFLDKHTHPLALDFGAKINQKNNLATSNLRKEYPNHTLKQNRTYQLGLVLMDRYGRSSGVITSNNLTSTSGFSNSSIFAGYTNGGAFARDWPGNCLELLLNEPIPSFMSEEGYPGLYSEKNPLGWYSYKVVVKQTEQEYYNVYVPGAIAGNITWNKKEEITKTVHSTSGATFTLTNATDLQPGMTVIKNNKSTGVFITDTAAAPAIDLSEDISDLYPNNSEIIFQQITYPTYLNPYTTSNIVLFGDNINKVPRDLNQVGPTDRIYSSDVRLFNRVNPIYDGSIPLFYNTQHTFASPLVGDEAVSIRPFRDLGEWTLQSSRYYPVANEYNATSATANAEIGAEKLQLFYKAEDNPFIATITTNSLIGVNPILSVSGTNNSDTYTNRNLGVFETEPTTSLLDIFWETSTSGLISDLNNEVASGSLGPADFSQITFNLTEAMPKLTQITNFFELVDANGNTINDASQVNMTGLTVVDGTGAPRNGDFTLIADQTASNVRFAIQTNNKFYYGSDANTRESYTFTINCIANGVTNTLSFNGQLSNITPFVYEDTIDVNATTNVITLAKIDNDSLVTKTYNTDLFSSLFTLPQPYSTTLPNIILDKTPNTSTLLLSFVSLNGSAIVSDQEKEMVVYLESKLTKFNGDVVELGQDETFIMSTFPLTSNKTLYRLNFNPKQVKDYDDDFNINGRPTYTFSFTLYDVIAGGGPGVTVEKLSNGNLTPASAPTLIKSGNNNLTFSFNVEFEV